MCAEAGLVWGEELYFDATKIEANASLESIVPRFAVEHHLHDLFEEDPRDPQNQARAPGVTAKALDLLPTSEDANLAAANAAKSDWISKAGRQDRQVKGTWYRRKADLFLSRTDPDASPMKRKKGADHSHLGYPRPIAWWMAARRASSWASWLPRPLRGHREQAHAGHALWRTAFRWRIWPRQVTGDSAYGTVEKNIAAVQKTGIRAYVALKGAGQGRPFFSARMSSPTIPSATSTRVRRVSPWRRAPAT
jgi:hypothetical protein